MMKRTKLIAGFNNSSIRYIHHAKETHHIKTAFVVVFGMYATN